MICPECSYDYPEDVPLNPIKGSLITSPICAICALAILNQVYPKNNPRTKFPTPLAEEYRQLALLVRSSGSAKKVNYG